MMQYLVKRLLTLDWILQFNNVTVKSSTNHKTLHITQALNPMEKDSLVPIGLQDLRKSLNSEQLSKQQIIDTILGL